MSKERLRRIERLEARRPKGEPGLTRFHARWRYGPPLGPPVRWAGHAGGSRQRKKIVPTIRRRYRVDVGNPTYAANVCTFARGRHPARGLGAKVPTLYLAPGSPFGADSALRGEPDGRFGVEAAVLLKVVRNAESGNLAVEWFELRACRR